MAKPRRIFTREFKISAVNLIKEQGNSFAEAARQLGIPEKQLRQWKKQLDAEGSQALPGHGNRTPLEAEVERLRSENRRLQMECDILKKAKDFFAREAT
jgi:transposase